MELFVGQTVLALTDNKFGKIKFVSAGKYVIRFRNGDIKEYASTDICPCMY